MVGLRRRFTALFIALFTLLSCGEQRPFKEQELLMELAERGATKALCRRMAYGAEAEGELRGSDRERLLRAASYATACIEIQYAEALRVFGRGYIPPPRVVFRGDELFGGEELARQHSRWANYAAERFGGGGNRYLKRIAIRDFSTLDRYLIYSRLLEYGYSPRYVVCSRCGYISDDSLEELFCPQCGSEQSLLRRF